ncbi:ferredoxin family protein [Candidatus Solincola tengchongensis]|uniref:4Fe-4S dicluster domain-containing protein n=1 Tax=Candidatus Solincola tengchongensis TaxID=2900693 RepID=UPI003312F9CA
MPCRPVLFDPELCTGCNACVDVRRKDVLFPNPEKGKPPLILYPDECWFCGCCVIYCPAPGFQNQSPIAAQMVLET